MTLTEFLYKHNACEAGRKRAAAFASLEDAWQNCSHEDLIWVATRPGVLTDKELRLFAVFCARSVQHLMTDPRSRDAIDVAERYADGLATDDELRSACADASDAARATTYTSAADDAAYTAAYISVARAADAARTAAYTSAARKRQTEWLRQNTKPNFS
jgi:hypothetical protein